MASASSQSLSTREFVWNDISNPSEFTYRGIFGIIYQMLVALRVYIYIFNAMPYLRIYPIEGLIVCIYKRTSSYEISHRIHYHTQQLYSLLGLSKCDYSGSIYTYRRLSMPPTYGGTCTWKMIATWFQPPRALGGGLLGGLMKEFRTRLRSDTL